MAGEAKEPVALRNQLGRHQVLGTEVTEKLGGGEECLAADAIEPLVVALVEVARCGAGAP